MGFLDRVKAALRGGQEQKAAPGDLAAWATLFRTGLDTSPYMTSESLVQPYAQHPTIYAAISAIANNLSSIPLEFFPLSDLEREMPDPEALPLELIENPNPLMAGRQLIEATVVNLELYGNAFWFKDGMARRTASGPQFPKTLECWDPPRVRPLMSGDRLTGWEYRTQNTTVRAGTDSVVHFKFFNPYDRVWGLAPLQAAMVVAGADFQADIWNRALFEHHAVPYGVLTPKANQLIDKDAMTRIRDQMEARHGGASRHGKLGATNIPMEFVEIGMSHKDMDFPTLLDKATEKILMIWKVPPVVAGILKDANYNVAVQQAKQFWHNHLPTLQYIETMIYLGLCKPYGIDRRPYFKTEVIKALTEDQEAISNMARNYWNMGVPFEIINERYELGFDTSEHESLETSWVPFSLVNADDQATAAASGAVGGPTRGPVEGDTPAQPGDESTVADDPTEGKATPEGRELFRRMNWRTVISAVRTEEMTMEKRIRDHFLALRFEVLGKLNGRAKAMGVTKEPLSFSVDAVLFDDEKAARDIEVKAEPVIKSSVKAGVDTISAVVGVQFDMQNPAVVKFIMEKMFEIADLVDGPALERLRDALAEGVRLGENLEKIAARVEDVFAIERSRARRIARTEVAEAFNAGRYAAMKEANVKRIEWLTARDNRVRETHADLDGDIVVLGDKFKNGLLYPLDPAGPPEEIVNCRCVALPA